MAIETKSTTDHRPQIVQIAGAATTLVAFALVFALAKSGENIMGWYANWIIPVGAVLVGMVAASGYAIAAWMTGLKMTTRLAWSVVGQLVLSYFIAQYESFELTVAAGSQLGFWEWFDLSTRAFSFSSSNGRPGDPMGVLGYVFRTLEVAGFVGGGVIVPLALKVSAYCEPCRSYKRRSTIAVIPGGMHPAHMTDGPYADPTKEALVAIYKAADGGDRPELERLVDAHGPLARKRAARKLMAFTTMSLDRCPRCAQAELTAYLTEKEGRNRFRVIPLGGITLPGDRVRQLFG